MLKTVVETEILSAILLHGLQQRDTRTSKQHDEFHTPHQRPASAMQNTISKEIK